MAAALFLAVAMGGLGYWDYHRKKIAYYADYVECRGVPRGIGELNAAEVQRRHLSWQFESSRYRVDAFAASTGSGSGNQPTAPEDADRPADRTFYYRDDGALEYAIEFTSVGKEFRKSVYAQTCRSWNSREAARGDCRCRPSFCRPRGVV